MCLAVPGQIERVGDETAMVNMQGNRLEVCTVMVEDPSPGEWVLVHAGYAISKIDAEDAARTWELLAEMAELKARDAADVGEGA